MIERAIDYAKAGWHVFPLAVGTKKPLVKWAAGVALGDAEFRARFEALLEARAQERCVEPGSRHPMANLWAFRATTNQETIESWWRLWPAAGVAVSTEPSNLLVLDIDQRSDVNGVETLRRLIAAHGELPKTALQQSGGAGWHAFFNLPPARNIRNSAGRLGPGLDVRARGGCVVLAPSRHPSGDPYQWYPKLSAWECPIADPPFWLVELLDAPPTPPRRARRRSWSHNQGRTFSGGHYAEAALRNEIAAIRSAPEGARNDALNRAAFSLGQLAAASLLNPGLTLRLLAGTALDAGLTEQEIAATLRSGFERGLARPRDYRP